ncbi:MAG: GH116 family glycosyl hydrolase [Candidatus Diapherotrites archaeon]|nr:GH116 family glycosyl hydrolase [Candidatus Diapherotrites archaeon]
MKPLISNAYDIALNDLRKCYTDKGILAGRNSKRYNQYWARNSFFASMGALKAGDFEQVKRNLRLFAALQGKNGAIANQVSLRLQPRYKLMIGSVMDASALFVVSLARYARETGDFEFAEQNLPQARKALLFLKSKDRGKDLLIEESVFANWAETVLKFGRVLYTNCCYFKALLEFGELCAMLEKKDLCAESRAAAAGVKERLNALFWVGNYYCDWVDFRKHDYFAADGNLLAIDWGIADAAQGNMILNKIKQHQLNKVPLQTNYPLYPIWRIPATLLPLMEYHYHNGSSWPWLGCLHAIALRKAGRQSEAKKELRKVAEMIAANGTTTEVFGSDGKPLRGLFLRSEHPFSWTAGFFLERPSARKQNQ